RAQTALEGYNAMREELRSALGDQSCLDQLRARMTSLDSHCLAGLRGGLDAMHRGDLTVEVKPVTTLITSTNGHSIAQLGAVFNGMLNKAQAALAAYEGTRANLAAMILDIHRNSEAVATASTQMAATSEEAGRAVGDIAHAVTEVAHGAELQVRSVEDTRTM